MDVQLNGKTYRKIETYTVGKLEHLLQLIETEITNYTHLSRNYSPEKQERCSKPFLRRLGEEKEKVQTLLKRD